MKNNQEKIIAELTNFLHKANKNTFANANIQKAQSLRPGSLDYHFEDGDFAYHDTYFGNRDFIGEEIVYYNQKPLWGMNYFGFMLDESITTKELGNFLEKAIMQEYSDIIPVRGPKKFVENTWAYTLSVDGGLDRFSGIEKISHNDKVAYHLHIQGGFIQ